MTILPLDVSGVSLAAGGRVLLDDISLTIRAGAPTIILGPNGAGKSLMLRVCHGLQRPDSGTVRWQGTGAAKARLSQAMIFQKPVMLRRSVRANVAYGLRLRGIVGVDAEILIEEALALTGLLGQAKQQAPTLSLGEQQRLALARVHALRPEVLFMDEPTASLDPGATGAVEQLIHAISATGTKIVMSTHDLAQAQRLAADVVFLHGGRLAESAPSDAFFAGPETEAARAFIEGRLLW